MMAAIENRGFTRALFAALFAAASLTLAWPQAARAQTDDPPAGCPSVSGTQEWVCNLGESLNSDVSINSSLRQAQGFTVGGASGDSYELNSVRIHAANTFGSPSLEVAIHERNGSTVGARVSGTFTCGAVPRSLNYPNNPGPGPAPVDCTTSDITLSGGTRYYVVMGTPGGGIALTATSSNNQEGSTGWSIGNSNDVLSGPRNSWNLPVPGADKIAIAVVATPPTPTTPPAPTNVMAEAGDKTITVDWTAGTAVPGQPAADGWNVCAILATETDFPSGLGNCAFTTTVSTPDPTTAMFTGLANGTDYRVAVRSFNNDSGARSAWIEADEAVTPNVPGGDPSLSNILVLITPSFSQAALTPTFDSDTLTYTASVESDVSGLQIIPSAAVSSSTVAVTYTNADGSGIGGMFTVADGANVVTIVVTAAEGGTRTYTVTITRGAPASSVATLGMLRATTSNGIELHPTELFFNEGAFSSTTYSYSADILHDEVRFILTATPSDEAASAALTHAGSAVTGNLAEGIEVPLAVGTNTTVITVTAEDGMTTQDYTFTLELPTLELTVAAEQASVDEAEGAMLSFSIVPLTAVLATDMDFTVTLTSDPPAALAPYIPAAADRTQTVRLPVGQGGAGARKTVHFPITLNGVDDGGASVTATFAPVASSTSSEWYTFAGDGTGTATAAIVDADGSGLSDDATLSQLRFSGGTGGAILQLTPSFAAGTYTYAVGTPVPNTFGTTTVTATRSDSNATVAHSVACADAPTDCSVSGNTITLAVGANVITTTVTAEDGMATQTYTTTITRAAAPPSGPLPSNVMAEAGDGEITVTWDVTGTVGATQQFELCALPTSINWPPDDDATGCHGGKGGAITRGPSLREAILSSLTNGTTYVVGLRITESGGTDSAWVRADGTFTPEAATGDASLGFADFTGGITLDPEFDSEVLTYTASVANSVSSTTIDTDANSGDADAVVTCTSGCSITGSAITLAVGANEITITVTAAGGAMRTYTITITRAGTLPVLTIAAVKTPVVEGTDATLDFTVTPSSAFATDTVITVTLSGADDFVDFGDFELLATFAASSAAAVTVMFPITDDEADESDATATATITANTAAFTLASGGTATAMISDDDEPLSSDATLTALSFSGPGGTPLTLNPPFDVDTYTYTVDTPVPNTLQTTTITSTRGHNGATRMSSVTCPDNPGTCSISGSTVTLAVGANFIPTLVTAEDGMTTLTYTVTIARAAPPLPVAPTDVSADADDASVTVNWVVGTAGTGETAASGHSVCAIPDSPTAAFPDDIASCTASAVAVVAPTATAPLSGLMNGTDYLIAVRSYDTDTAQVSEWVEADEAVTPMAPAPTTPPAPTDVTATALDASIRVDWTAGTAVSGQPAADGWNVCAILATETSFPSGTGGCAKTTTVSIPTPTTATVTGLTNDTAYRVAVRSFENNIGRRSDWVEATGTATPAATPPVLTTQPPSAVTATALAGGVRVAWTAPTAARVPSGYDTCVYATTTGAAFAASNCTGTAVRAATGVAISTGQVDWTELTAGTPYWAAVRGTHGDGDSVWMAASAQATPEEVMPHPPTAVTASEGDAQIVVNWEDPDTSTGNSEPQSFRACAVATADAFPTSHSDCVASALATSDERTATLTGLENGTAYKVAVRSVVHGTGGGASAWIASTPATVMPMAAPTGLRAPHMVTASVDSSTQITVLWQVDAASGDTDPGGWQTCTILNSDATGFPATGFANCVRSGRQTNAASARQLPTTMLTPGTAYRIAVRGTNADYSENTDWVEAAGGPFMTPAAPTLPALTIASAGDATEGADDSLDFTVTPSSAFGAQTEVTVTLTGADAFVASGARTQTATFAASSMAAQTVSFAITDDEVDEPNATATATITPNAAAFTLASGGTATAMISDGDEAATTPHLTLALVGGTANVGFNFITEGATANLTADFTVTPSVAFTAQTEVVVVATGANTFIPTASDRQQTVTFTAGSTAAQTARFPLADDNANNGNETLTATIQANAAYTASDPVMVRIEDDEAPIAAIENIMTMLSGTSVTVTWDIAETGQSPSGFLVCAIPVAESFTPMGGFNAGTNCNRFGSSNFLKGELFRTHTLTGVDQEIRIAINTFNIGQQVQPTWYEAPATVSPTVTVTSAPSSVTATPGDGEIVVSWTAPTEARVPTGYQFCVYEQTTIAPFDDARCTSPFTATATQITAGMATLGGLDNDAAHWVAVRGTHDDGDSRWVSTAARVTPSATPVVTAVAAPTGVTVAVGDTVFIVRWAAGTAGTGVSAATGFEACAIAAGTASFPSARSGCVSSGTAAASETTAVIGSLTNGTAYRVAVRAVDSVNDFTSAWREASGTYTPAPAGLTAAPTTLTIAEPAGEGTYTLVLNTDPEEQVTVTPGGVANTLATFSPGVVTFTGGASGNWGVAQTITVMAVNDDLDNAGDERTGTITHALGAGAEYGSLPASAIGTVALTVTDDDDAATPSSDASLSALSLSAGRLAPAFAAGTLVYTASVANSVSSVDITATPNDAGASVSEIALGGTAITGTTVALAVGANVITVEVTAEDGTTRVYTVTVTRARALPSAPQGLTVTPRSGQLMLTWSAPSVGGSLTGYDVCILTGAAVSDANCTGNALTSLAAGATTHTFSGLTDGTAYNVGVRAENAVGTGAWASASGTPNLPALSIAAAAAVFIEAPGAVAEFTVSSDQPAPAETELVVTLTGADEFVAMDERTQTVTLAMDARSVDVEFPIVSDDVREDDALATATLALPASGDYRAGTLTATATLRDAVSTEALMEAGTTVVGALDIADARLATGLIARRFAGGPAPSAGQKLAALSARTHERRAAAYAGATGAGAGASVVANGAERGAASASHAQAAPGADRSTDNLSHTAPAPGSIEARYPASEARTLGTDALAQMARRGLTSLNLGVGGGFGLWTAASRADVSGAASRHTDTAYDGESSTVQVGLDRRYKGGALLLGVAVGWNASEVDFAQGDALGGQIERNDVMLYPYVSWRRGASSSLWLLGGVGVGDYELTLRRGASSEAEKSDAMRWLLAGGLEQTLQTSDALRLSARFGGLWSRSEVDASERLIVEFKSDAWQAESELELAYTGARSLRPYLLGTLRTQGGDGTRTDVALDAGGGVQGSFGMGLTFDLGVRRQLSAREDHKAHLVYGSLRYDRGGDGRGFTASLSQGMSEVLRSDWRTGEFGDAGRASALNTEHGLQARFGYGWGARLGERAGVLTAFAQMQNATPSIGLGFEADYFTLSLLTRDLLEAPRTELRLETSF